MPEKLAPPISITKAGRNETYAIAFDHRGYEEFLAQAGVQPGELAGQRIIITSRPKKRSNLILGEYRMWSKKMRIYLDSPRKIRDQYLARVEDVLETEDPGDEKFDRFDTVDSEGLPASTKTIKLYSGRRLAMYLATSPDTERARKTAEKLIDTAINRNLNSTLRHETKHMIEGARGELLPKHGCLSALAVYTGCEAAAIAAIGAVSNYLGTELNPFAIGEGTFIAFCLGLIVNGVIGGVGRAERRARKFERETRSFPPIIYGRSAWWRSGKI